jgi:NADPH-dependent 2,4-dienoyl-CoA reductase/sulfur reductase-like enzyme
VLVLGAGVAGIEAARVLAGRGHHVEVWEKTDRLGGQMHLATAAPDKREVEPVWSYRWQEVEALNVTIHTGVAANEARVRAFAPDFAIVATGATDRPAPFDVSPIGADVRVMHAWDYLARPEAVAAGARVTIVGGGMVGMEAADLLVARGARVTVIEALATIAQGMARNNRLELVERVQARGAEILTDARIVLIAEATLDLELGAQATRRRIELGDVLMIAIGPQPVRDMVPVLERAQVPYELIGDCYRPGDFLTAIRDAWMVALSVDRRFAHPVEVEHP